MNGAGAAIGGIASLAGGAFGSSGSSDAAAAQVAAIEAQVRENRRQFDLTREDSLKAQSQVAEAGIPAAASGYNALAAYNAELGLGPSNLTFYYGADGPEGNSAYGALPTIFTEAQQAAAERRGEASAAAAGGTAAAGGPSGSSDRVSELKAQIADLEGRMPYWDDTFTEGGGWRNTGQLYGEQPEAAERRLSSLRTQLSVAQELARQPAPAAPAPETPRSTAGDVQYGGFEETPIQQYQRQQVEEARLAANAKFGGLDSGATRQQLEQDASAQSYSYYDTYLNRLAGLAGYAPQGSGAAQSGVNTALSLGSLGAQYAGINSGLASQIGSAQANGILGTTAAYQGGLQGIGNSLNLAAQGGLFGGSGGATSLGYYPSSQIPMGGAPMSFGTKRGA